MGKIIVLDENTSNKIAAGEVIERPASVVKELAENAIDAGAGSISVEIKNGGISYIRVTDNGMGIDEDDVVIAFERYATSKIKSSDDLDSITTLGFRGEALASIAAVSNVQLTTRVGKNPHGMYVEISGGTVKEVKQTGCPVGTTFVVKDLFFNTPARYKFLKKDSTEAGYISDIISRTAMGNPHISFRLISNNSAVIHTPGNNDLLSTIFSIYGKETAREVLELKYSDDKIKISGYVGKPEIARSNRNHQSIYLNGRYIKSKVITSAIDEAYKTFLMKNKYAFIVMNIEINPFLVDINVHPTKMEVRFSNEQDIFRSVFYAVNNALLQKPLVKAVELDHKVEKPFSFIDRAKEPSKVDYKQQLLDIDRYAVKEPFQKVERPELERDKEGENLNEFEYNLEKSEYNLEKTENNKPVIAGDYRQGVTTGETSPVDADIRREDMFQDDAGKGSLANARIVGQAFSTYILLEFNDELIMVDQHAAHERIMFERLKKLYMDNKPLAQMLAAPVVLELTHQEVKFLEDEKIFFNKLGFIYENFGNNSIVLRSVPYADQSSAVKEFFLEVLDHVMASGRSDYNLNAEDTLYTVACKAAVKANKKLGDIEIREILKGLEHIKNPYTCPHGRPTAIKIAKHEFEKKFKRVI